MCPAFLFASDVQDNQLKAGVSTMLAWGPLRVWRTQEGPRLKAAGLRGPPSLHDSALLPSSLLPWTVVCPENSG